MYMHAYGHVGMYLLVYMYVRTYTFVYTHARARERDNMRIIRPFCSFLLIVVGAVRQGKNAAVD